MSTTRTHTSPWQMTHGHRRFRHRITILHDRSAASTAAKVATAWIQAHAHDCSSRRFLPFPPPTGFGPPHAPWAQVTA